MTVSPGRISTPCAAASANNIATSRAPSGRSIAHHNQWVPSRVAPTSISAKTPCRHTWRRLAPACPGYRDDGKDYYRLTFLECSYDQGSAARIYSVGTWNTFATGTGRTAAWMGRQPGGRDGSGLSAEQSRLLRQIIRLRPLVGAAAARLGEREWTVGNP